MRGTGRDGPEIGLVIAARGGDPRALDLLVGDSLPLVYNIVGRALDGHGDVDDVVQETLLRVVRHLPALRDPEAYRSWLVAIAVRQVRDWRQDRRTRQVRDVGVDVAYEVPDPAGDFAGLTILRLGLTDQRREIAAATRWLDQDDRDLLALWWLEETGELARAELAEALGLRGDHAAVRVQRMKEQLQAARGIVRALAARPGCQPLHGLLGEWDGVPSPLWRKRLSRHVRECVDCGRLGADLLPIDRLLAGLPLLPVPPGLVDHILATATSQAASGAPVAGQGPVPPDITAGTRPGSTSGGPGAARPEAGSASPRDGAARGAHAARPRGLGRLLSGGSRVVVVPVAAAVALVAIVAGVLVVTRPATPSAAPVAEAGATAPVATGSGLPTVGPGSPSATASPGPRSPSPTPRRSTARPAVPAAPAVTSDKKGVAVWTFDGVSKALDQSNASWYYTWSPQHSGISTPKGVSFVPMIWGAKDVNAGSLAQAKSAGRYLLGFNEPDTGGQANMSPEQALDLWPQLVATGNVLGSPAVAFGGADAGGWLDRFMSGARSRKLRVDFIALHWYGGDFRTANAVQQLKSYLQAVYNRYHVPIWLTEYALIDFSNGTKFPSQEQQAAFVTASAKMLKSLSFLQRYAWFGLPASDKDQSGLFSTGAKATAVGRAFQSAG